MSQSIFNPSVLHHLHPPALITLVRDPFVVIKEDMLRAMRYFIREMCARERERDEKGSTRVVSNV